MREFMPSWAFFALGWVTLMLAIPSSVGVLILREMGASGAAETGAGWAMVLIFVGALQFIYGFFGMVVAPNVHRAVAWYRGVGTT